MKYLYLQFLRLRVWALRRRLRRLGFRASDTKAPPRIMPRLKMERMTKSGRFSRCLYLLILIIGFVIWIAFYLKVADPAVTRPKDRHEVQRPFPPTVQPSSFRLA